MFKRIQFYRAPANTVRNNRKFLRAVDCSFIFIYADCSRAPSLPTKRCLAAPHTCLHRKGSFAIVACYVGGRNVDSMNLDSSTGQGRLVGPALGLGTF